MMMKKFIAGFSLISLMIFNSCLADPDTVDKTSDDDMKTSETFGYGYYQPGFYGGAPLAAAPHYNTAPLTPVATYPAVPLATRTSLSSASSSGYSRSGYGYGSGYKYGGGYGYGSRFGYGSGGAATNEFYRSHPVYVAWG